MSEWMSESMNHWIRQSMHQWITDSMTQGLINQWNNESVISCTHEWVSQGGMNGWMSTWMDGPATRISLTYVFTGQPLIWATSALTQLEPPNSRSIAPNRPTLVQRQKCGLDDINPGPPRTPQFFTFFREILFSLHSPAHLPPASSKSVRSMPIF